MNEPTVSVLPMVALRAPRKFSCHALPEGAFAPPEGEAAERLGAAVGAALGLRALTPVARQIAPDVWLCAFLHGEARRRWVATYERGRPGRVAYIPRSAEVVVADRPRGLLYLSCSDAERGRALLPALNGALFPDRRPAEPFDAPTLDLAPFRLMGPGDRRPLAPGAPWAVLTLKGMTWQEPGLAGPLTRRLWPTDGFEALDALGGPWPERLRSLAFAVRPAGAPRGYVAELFQGPARLRATLSPLTLDALAALMAFARSA